jgi:uncharacterized Zn finger protein (UPF0148 family)
VTEPACPSCSTPYIAHPGLVACCAGLRDAKARMATARAALLRVWPKGKDCEHSEARVAFEALEP